MDILLSGLSGKPGATPLLLVSGKTPTGYRLMEAQWGLPSFTSSYSGMRGTQGARLAGREAENVVSSLVFQIVGEDQDELHERFSSLATFVDECSRFGGTLTRRAQGASFTDYPEVLDALVVEPQFGRLYHRNHRLTVTVQFVTPPYANGAPMDVSDDFSTDTLSEYTFDAGAPGDVAVTSGELDAVANLTGEKRLIHTATGYSYGDHQATVKATPGATITDFAAGVILKRTASDTYLVAWVADNGTNSYVQLLKVIAGVGTHLTLTNFGARITAGVPWWVRGRIEGNVVVVEHFTSEPTPMGTPANVATHTLTGAEVTSFGADVVGKAGLIWRPYHTDAKLDDFSIEPYTYRNLPLPQEITLRGAIPGDALALADVSITLPTAATLADFALIGWASRPNHALAPFGIIEAESGGGLGVWAVTADGDYRGGSGLQASPAGASDLAVSFGLAPAMVPDAFRGDSIDIEVWARVELASTLVSPKLTLSAYSGFTTNLHYTSEYGTLGKALVKPSGGTRFRFVRLGTITLNVEDPVLIGWTFVVAGRVEATSSGVFGLDYLVPVLPGSRAMGPTGKPNDSSYPAFFPPTGNQVKRTVRSDLSGGVSIGGISIFQSPIHGLGGSLIELPPGDVDFVVKLSDLVPDDPTSDATSETLSHSGTVHVGVTPRWTLARS